MEAKRFGKEGLKFSVWMPPDHWGWVWKSRRDMTLDPMPGFTHDTDGEGRDLHQG